MSFHKRSTNERVLARRHLKRSPDAARRAGEDISPSTTATLSPSSISDTPHAPVVTVLPAIGTHSLVPVSSPSTASTIPPNTVAASISSTTPSVSSISSSTSSLSSPSVQVSPSSLTSYTPTASRAITSATSARADAAATESSSSGKLHGMAPGVIGGIVVVVVILALLFTGFFVRKRAQRRRAMKRNTWGAGLVPALEHRRNTVYGGQPYMSQSMAPNGGVPAPDRLDNVPKTFEMQQSPSAHGIPGPAAPPMSFNPSSPLSPLVPSSLRVPSLRSIAPSTISSATAPSEFAVVARTFIPSLPDELHIANGEQIRILNSFDDGWALCSNSRGDQGVVPLECLEKVMGVTTEMQLQPQSEFSSEPRTSKRMTSLVSNAAGTY